MHCFFFNYRVTFIVKAMLSSSLVLTFYRYFTYYVRFCMALPDYKRLSLLAISQSSRGLGLVACLEGQKINNMLNMASRKFSYIPKVICAA